MDREYEWHCADGRIIEIKELEDTHLANIIQALKKNQRGHALISVMEEEAEYRGLSTDFLSLAQIPYKKDGAWYTWCFATQQEKIISK